MQFCFPVRDILQFSLRLAQEAQALRSPLCFAGSDPKSLQELDVKLWLSPKGAFLPHDFLGAEKNLDDPPVFIFLALSDALEKALLPPGMTLVNLGETAPHAFGRFSLVIEPVGENEPMREMARRRWRHYREMGAAPSMQEIPAASIDSPSFLRLS